MTDADNSKICPACGHENPADAVVCEGCATPFDAAFYSEETTFQEQMPDSFAPGDLIAGRYLVEKILGQGGMGVVYLVTDSELGDLKVALKMIHPHLVAHPEAAQRFSEEVVLCLKLLHPGIIRVYDLKSWQGLRFFTMEYVAGRSLRDWMEERQASVASDPLPDTPAPPPVIPDADPGSSSKDPPSVTPGPDPESSSNARPPFTLAETLAVARPLLKALAYAHQHTVHRDIKPENIMLTGDFPDIGLKILDFGIAKTLSPSRFTQTAQSLGTAYYMAPEQMQGAKTIDHRADLYSVGMVLYEMLTGRKAVGRFKLPGEIIDGLPPELDELTDRALAPEPQDRFADARKMRDALDTAEAAWQTWQEGKQQQQKIDQLLADSRASLGTCQWPEAIRLLQELLEIDPEHEEAASLLQQAQNKQKNRQQLEADLEKAEAADDLQKALALIEELLPLTADQTGLKEKKKALAQKQAEQKAQKEAEKKRRQEIDQLLADSRAALEKCQWDQAIGHLEKLLEMDAGHETGQEMLQEARDMQQRKQILESDLKKSEAAGNIEKALQIIDKLFPVTAEHNALKQRKKVLEQKRAEQEAEEEQRQKAEKEKQEALRREQERKKQEQAEREKAAQEKQQQEAAARRRRNSILGLAVPLLVVVVLLGIYFAVSRQSSSPVKRPSSTRSSRPNATAPSGSSFTNSLGMKFVYIKPGTFMMGSPSSESGRYSNERQHRVTLTRGFYMQTTEVTIGQYREFLKATHKESGVDWGDDDCPIRRNSSYSLRGNKFGQSSDQPMVEVSWHGARAFADWLSQKTGQTYRLPTEAEWEYACRAGTTGPFHTGSCLSTSQANYDGNYPLSGCSKGQYRRKTVPVASFAPNAWGLYDMHGNVWEWCQDRYGDYPSGSVTDPTGPSSGSLRVSRGGSWLSYALGCRSANRSSDSPGHTSFSLGFRLCVSQAGR